MDISADRIRHPAEQLSGERSRISSWVRLPCVVLMRICIVRDAANDQASSVNVDARGFHLDAKRPVTFCADLTPQFAILDDRITSSDSPTMEDQFALVTFSPLGSLHKFVLVTCHAIRSIISHVAVCCPKQLIGLEAGVRKLLMTSPSR